MPTIRMLLNGAPLASGGGLGYSSLDWDVTASRYERACAVLQLRGLKDRQDGNYDCHYWLEGFELRAGDRIEVFWDSSEEDAAPARIETHEQAEEFRANLGVSLEGADVPVERAPLLRQQVMLRLEVSGMPPEDVIVSGEIHLGCCNGFWARDRYADQWNVRVATHPPTQKRTGVWHPTTRSIRVSLPA